MQRKIANLEAFVLRAPNDARPHWVSHFIAPRASEILLQLRTSDGVEGFGLATSYAGMTQIIEALRSGIGEQILGMDPLAPERLHQKLSGLTSQRLAHEKGRGREALIRIAAAADIACWDIIGKMAGLPLYQLFGGYRDRVPCYVTCAYYRDDKDFAELRDEMQTLKAQGHTGFKAKAGGLPLGEDIKRLELVRDVIGNGLSPIRTATHYKAELFENPPKIANGWVTLNEAPGLGLTLSAPALKKFGQRIL